MHKDLVFIINTNQNFIRTSGKDAEAFLPVLNDFFESISEVYLPLLNMLERLEGEGVRCRFGLVLAPVLCSLLEKAEIQKMYVEWLEKRITLGQKQLSSINSSKSSAVDKSAVNIIEKTIEKNKQLLADYEKKYECNLIKKFSEYHQKGYIELLATCGTDIFIPHYADLLEVVSAQIETGLQSYRNSFGEFPDGFWLPELGYMPGIEKIIRAYGYSYTILDARSVLLCENLPTKGIFYPSRTENSLAIFANSPEIDDELLGENGFALNEVYRNTKRDIGFELPLEQLDSVIPKGSPRYSTGYRYWNRCFEGNCIYNDEAAMKQAEEDARAFLSKKAELLEKAAELLPESDYVVSVCALDAGELRKSWSEWLVWFEDVMRYSSEYELKVSECCELLDKQFSLEKIYPYYSAAGGDGYGESFVSSKNSWMIRYIRKASERMIDLADRFPNDTGLKTRLLNLGAKELLLAQSVNLAKMIENEEFSDFAEKRFKDSIKAFTSVFDSLGSNTVSTEWLTTLEERDNLFPWMNYRIFSKKK